MIYTIRDFHRGRGKEWAVHSVKFESGGGNPYVCLTDEYGETFRTRKAAESHVKAAGMRCIRWGNKRSMPDSPSDPILLADLYAITEMECTAPTVAVFDKLADMGVITSDEALVWVEWADSLFQFDTFRTEFKQAASAT